MINLISGFILYKLSYGVLGNKTQKGMLKEFEWECLKAPL